MKIRSIRKILAAAVLASVLTWAPQAALTAAHEQPAHGLILTGEAKQAYITEKMQAFSHPAPDAAPPAFELPDGWTIAHERINGVTVDRITPAEKRSDRVLLQLHGGGYIMALTDIHRSLAVRQAVLMNAGDIYCVDYRTAPAHLYPAALEDAVHAYEGILARGVSAENIILVGDSAGGNLALGLALYLKDHGIAQPGVIALASPWTTMEHRAGTSRTTKAAADQVLGIGTPLYGPVQTGDYSGGAFPRSDPRLSPIYADLSGLPPILIQTGGNELFLTENEELEQKAAADGVTATLTVYPGMPHDFALLFPELEDSVQSLQEIADFVNRYMD